MRLGYAIAYVPDVEATIARKKAEMGFAQLTSVPPKKAARLRYQLKFVAWLETAVQHSTAGLNPRHAGAIPFA